MKLKISVYNLVAIEHSSGVEESLATFTSMDKAVAYGELLIQSSEETCWAEEDGKDGLSVSGPQILRINPKFKLKEKQ